MINVNKEAKTLAEAVGITEEQFNVFGNKMVDSINEFADIILEKGTEKEEKKVGISRIDFLERLASLSQEELLLLALTSFENHIQQAVSFKVQEEKERLAEEEEVKEIQDFVKETPGAEAIIVQDGQLIPDRVIEEEVIEDAVIVEDTVAEELPKETPEV